MPNKTTASLGQAPLLRRLGEWGQVSPQPGKRLFTDRLAALIDIGDAITLADFFKTLDKISANPSASSAPIADTLFESRRDAMRAFIDASFKEGDEEKSVDGSKIFRLPRVSDTALTDTRMAAKYQRFYELHQSELERRTSAIRAELLGRLTSESDALAQVAAIEMAFEPIFLRYSRRCFGRLPDWVAQRFEILRTRQLEGDNADNDPAPWLQRGGWLALFHRDVQRLLQAELQLRLQPLEGILTCLALENMAQEDS